MPRSSQDESSNGATRNKHDAKTRRKPSTKRRRAARSRRTIGGSILPTGPSFWGMVAVVALFLILNILLHSRLDSMDHPQQSSNEMPHLRDNVSPEKHPHTASDSQELLAMNKPSPNIRKPVLLPKEEKKQPPLLEKKPPELPVNIDEQRPPEKPANVNPVLAQSDMEKQRDETTPKEETQKEAPKQQLPIVLEEEPFHEGDDQVGTGKLYTFRGAKDNNANATNKQMQHQQQHLSSEVIDMRLLTSTLKFDNPDGGAWKQGWDVQPRSVSEQKPLTIFIVPHSHNDPGWIKTFDAYFRTQTIHIITTVVEALEKDPRRKFIWAEISYFSWWWTEQDLGMRQRAMKVLESGQLEFVTGGWVMPDEANSQIYALEIQMQEGHTWIRENLGPQYVPKYGWSIDPFGYSPTIPYVLSNFNFEGILIQRVHYAVKKELAKRKHLEFYWRQTWDEDGTHDMFTHVMPFYSYDVPHTCGPDPAVCCQFDYGRSPFGKYGKCPWKKDPVKITPQNVAERARLYVDQHLKKSALYRGNAVLIPLGDDFRYDNAKEAEDQYTNHQAIMDYVNENIPGVTMQFGTLREYFEKIKGSFEPPILKGSFFTYSDVNQDYWSGYFTSRAFDKALDRQLERVLFAAEALGAEPIDLRGPRRELSLFQHHDGVTGTAKPAVVEDYAKRLFDSINETHDWILNAMRELAPGMKQIEDKLEPCWQAGIPRGYTQGLCADDGEAFVFNPLEQGQVCGDRKISGKSVAEVKLPCERPGPLVESQNTVQFDPTTGLMTSPLREEWMIWKVRKGGAYLFFPETLVQYDMKDAKISQGGWEVETDTWKRTLIERTSPNNATIFDFIFQVNLHADNQEWFVRFNTDVKNEGVFHTDLNGFNFDTHYFRSDLPIQSQVFPMPTHASIQDKNTRLTVLSEHAQGTASLQDGAIDVFLDRRLRQDDARGLGQGVQDNAITRTRLRVVLEQQDFATNGEFQITPFCRKEWNKLNHPLEVYGVHVRDYEEPPPPPQRQRPLPPPNHASYAQSKSHVQAKPQNHVEPHVFQAQAQSHVESHALGVQPSNFLKPHGAAHRIHMSHDGHDSILNGQLENFVKPDPVPMDATMPYKVHKTAEG
eukprot:scaffold2102_cov161-Amphora_coffeaeformis.AAC.15